MIVFGGKPDNFNERKKNVLRHYRTKLLLDKALGVSVGLCRLELRGLLQLVKI